jgi:CRISPR/Cas system-associated exonuclease Cas4 (RecB family)
MDYYETDTAKKLLSNIKPEGTPIEQITSKSRSVSVLIRCPRKVVLDSLSPESDETTAAKAGGTSIHSALERGSLSSAELPLDYDGVHGYIDILSDVPLELYTTRRGDEYSPDNYPDKTAQLLAYIYMGLKTGMLKDVSGEIVIFYLYKRVVKSWRIHPTEEELESNWKRLKENQNELKAFIESGGKTMPKMNPLNRECTHCLHRSLCFGDDEI